MHKHTYKDGRESEAGQADSLTHSWQCKGTGLLCVWYICTYINIKFHQVLGPALPACGRRLISRVRAIHSEVHLPTSVSYLNNQNTKSRWEGNPQHKKLAHLSFTGHLLLYLRHSLRTSSTLRRSGEAAPEPPEEIKQHPGVFRSSPPLRKVL